MAQNKFDRRIVVDVPRKKIRHPEVQIEGVINFTERLVDDVSTVRIYNVGDPVVDALTEAETVEVRAGHEGNVGVVREGLTRKVSTETQDGDRVVELTIGSGIDELQETFISESYKGGVRAADLVEDLAEQLPNVEVGNLNFPQGAGYPNKVFSTTAFSVLDELGRDWDRLVYLKDLQLFVEEPGFTTPDRNVYINRDNGLKEIPRAKDLRSDDPTFSARMVLSHVIEPGSTATVNEGPAEGTYRVINGRHKLTNFETEASLREAEN